MKAPPKKKSRFGKKSTAKTRGTLRSTLRRSEKNRQPAGSPALREAQKPPTIDPNGSFVVCLNGKGEILTGVQRYGAKKRTLPGGGVHPNEHADMAGLREVHEESGLFLLARNLSLVGLMSQRIPAMPNVTGLVAIFETAVTETTARYTDGELDDFEWLSIYDAVRRREEFSPPMLRVMWLAHLRRHSEGAPNYFTGHMTEPVHAVLPGGRIVCV